MNVGRATIFYRKYRINFFIDGSKLRISKGIVKYVDFLGIADAVVCFNVLIKGSLTFFAKKPHPSLQCGFNPLSFSYLFQWAKATLEENAKIVKEPDKR